MKSSLELQDIQAKSLHISLGILGISPSLVASTATSVAAATTTVAAAATAVAATAASEPSSATAAESSSASSSSSVSVAPAVPASSAAAGRVSELLNLRRNLLLGLSHHLDELSRELGPVLGHERVGNAFCAGSAGTSDTVHVVLDRSWKGEVDNNANVLDI